MKSLVHLNTTTAHGKEYWQARWIDAQGKRRCQGLGACESMLKAAATRLCRQIERERATLAGESTLGAWTTEYLAEAQAGEATLSNHARVCGWLVDFFGKGRRLDKISRNDAERFAGWLRARTVVRAGAEQPVDENTVRTQVRVCKAVFNAAHRRDLVTFNPFDRIESSDIRPDLFVRMLSPEEFGRIIDACPGAPERCLFGLCRWAGLRPNEALKCRWSDINWLERTIAVAAPDAENPTRKRTSKSRARYVPIVPDLYRLLDESFSNAPVGSERPTDGLDRRISRMGHKAIKTAGVAYYGAVFYALRKMCERAWLEQGHPGMFVHNWLGHNPTTAARHYVEPTPESITRVTTSGDFAETSPYNR